VVNMQCRADFWYQQSVKDGSLPTSYNCSVFTSQKTHCVWVRTLYMYRAVRAYRLQHSLLSEEPEQRSELVRCNRHCHVVSRFSVSRQTMLHILQHPAISCHGSIQRGSRCGDRSKCEHGKLKETKGIALITPGWETEYLYQLST